MGIFKKKHKSQENVVLGDTHDLQRSTQNKIVTDPQLVQSILEEEIESFFPSIGIWDENCFERSTEVGYQNLPCNLKNNVWLAKLLQISIAHRQNISISFDAIYDFVSHSERFEHLRHQYELEIVRWEIEHIRSGGTLWLTRPEFGGNRTKSNRLWDKAFRLAVVDTLCAIGIDPETIEEGLETFWDLWREDCMVEAFENSFEPNLVLTMKEQMDPADQAFKENWLKVRRFEYYVEHKKSVDKYGTLAPGMNMPISELATVAEQLKAQTQDRNQYIEQYKAKLLEGLGAGRKNDN